MSEKYPKMPDMCQACKGKAGEKIYYPKQVKPKIKDKGETMTGYYTCNNGHTWTCNWDKSHL